MYGGEEGLVEDLFLIGNELTHAVGNFHGAALQLDHADGDAVQVKDQVRPALVTPAQGHFLGQCKVIVRPVIPFHEMYGLMWLPGSDLDLHAVTQELIRSQIRLIERDAGSVGRGKELLQGGGDMRLGVPARSQVRAEQLLVDAAVVLAFAPVAKVAIAEAVDSRVVREEGDDAVLSAAFGAWLVRHGPPGVIRDEFCRLAAPASLRA